MLGDILICLLFFSKFKWCGHFFGAAPILIFWCTSHSPLSGISIFVKMLRRLPALGGANKSSRC